MHNIHKQKYAINMYSCINHSGKHLLQGALIKNNYVQWNKWKHYVCKMNLIHRLKWKWHELMQTDFKSLDCYDETKIQGICSALKCNNVLERFWKFYCVCTVSLLIKSISNMKLFFLLDKWDRNMHTFYSKYFFFWKSTYYNSLKWLHGLAACGKPNKKKRKKKKKEWDRLVLQQLNIWVII